MSQRKDPRRKIAAEHRAKQRSTDVGVFAAVVMVGGFGLLLWFLMDFDTFRHAVVGYVLAVAGLINFFALAAYRGRKLALWQQSFARVPLRFAGYGTAGGRPVEAAKGQATARNAVLASAALSAGVVVVLAVLLIGM
jgi:hypothetical protein